MLQRIEVKKPKSMPGREGIAWRCELWIGGRKAADVHDDGNGGEVRFLWYDDIVHGLAARFAAWARGLPPLKSETVTQPGDEMAGVPITMDSGMAVARLMDELETRKKVARDCKKQTLFWVPGDADGSVRTLAHPPHALSRVYLADKYPGVIIINDLVDQGRRLPWEMPNEIEVPDAEARADRSAG